MQNCDSSAEISVETLNKAISSVWSDLEVTSYEDMYHIDHYNHCATLTENVIEEYVITEFDCTSLKEFILPPPNRKGVFNCFHLKVRLEFLTFSRV